MRYLIKSLAWLILLVCISGEAQMSKSIYDIEIQTIDHQKVLINEYKDKVILIVNTASRCGFTYQYEELQEVYNRYQHLNFVVLAFPCNNFMSQEPGSNEQIKEFCQSRYNISFPIFAKLHVKGENQHPLYTFLTSKKTNPNFYGKILWNFNKFLISSQGEIIERFGSRVSPKNKKVITAIEKALNIESNEY